MIRTLLPPLWTVALCGAVVVALLPPRPAEVSPSLTLRRRARWLSWAFGIAGLPLALGSIFSLPIGGPPNPLGLIAFVLLCVLGAVAFGVLRWAWASARDAANAEHRAEAELYGPAHPSAPPAPQAHRGLSGEDAPPTRW